jgi:hypothetical protein
VSAAHYFPDECFDRRSGQQDGFRHDAEAPGYGSGALYAGLLLRAHQSREIPAAREESARDRRDVLDDVGDR